MLTDNGTSHSAEGPRGDAAPIRLADRVLAEAVRAVERDGAALLDEPTADDAARAGGGDFETRVARRARGTSIAPALASQIRTVRQGTTWLLLGAVVLALITGAGAVRAALGAPGAEAAVAPVIVNFFWVLTSLLGVQTLLLVGWVLLVLARPRAVNVSPLGSAALATSRWLITRGRQGTEAVAAVQASGAVHARGPIGRWTFSAISHALWATANIGALVMLIVLLSTKHYTFNWETTILSARAYEQITNVLAALPKRTGFPTPTREQIAATEAGHDTREPEAARAWSGLLVASIVLYGFGPRILLLGLCLGRRRVACRRFRLDTSAPGYHALRNRLMPAAESQGVVDDEVGSGPSTVAAPAPPDRDLPSSPSTGDGPPVILGLEIEPPASSWPPRIPGVSWNDLAFVDDRSDRRRVLDALEALDQAPRLVVVVCTLTATPDRGLGSFISQLVERAPAPVGVLLTGGQALRDRTDATAAVRRVDDWHTLSMEAGVPAKHVLEIDLDHLTEASLARLAAFVGVEPGTPAPVAQAGRRIETAFAKIAASTRAWSDTPTTREQVELQREIAKLYRHEKRERAGSLRGWLGAATADAGGVIQGVHASASRVVDMLPDRLRHSPRWLIAGALSGAVGCLAIGTLLTPAAFAAVPAWMMGGAGLGGLLNFARGATADVTSGETTATETPGIADVVRAAALFALLLELQGRSETEITRVLDRTLPGEEDDAPSGPGQAAVWLDDLRHRFDLAQVAGDEGTAS